MSDLRCSCYSQEHCLLQVNKHLVLYMLNSTSIVLGTGGEGTESHSLFVGDLALEVTDLLLQKHFQQFFPSVNSAKVPTKACSMEH